MTKTVALLQLAERCENATGPDVVLERDIALSLGWRHLRNKGPTQDDEPYHWVAPNGSCHDGFPDYLTSLDAAMQLVPEGWAKYVADDEHGCHACVWDRGSPQKRGASGGCKDAATPALALCAAALRARASQGNNNV